MAKLSEVYNYNTNAPFDAFEVGRKLSLTEEETNTRVNYAIEKNGLGNLILLSIELTPEITIRHQYSEICS